MQGTLGSCQDCVEQHHLSLQLKLTVTPISVSRHSQRVPPHISPRMLLLALTRPPFLLAQVEAILPLLKRGVGIHHGGLLPILKEVIEILFQVGFWALRVGQAAQVFIELHVRSVHIRQHVPWYLRHNTLQNCALLASIASIHTGISMLKVYNPYVIHKSKSSRSCRSNSTLPRPLRFSIPHLYKVPSTVLMPRVKQ